MLSSLFCSPDCLSGAPQPFIFADRRSALKKQQPKKYCWMLCTRFPLNLSKFVFYTQPMPFVLFYSLSVSLEHELL